MKLIDLLKKIEVNEIPEKIKYKDTIYYFDGLEHFYKSELGTPLLVTIFDEWSDIVALDEEVEIIEEDKEIEKLKSLHNVGNSTCFSEFSDKQHLNNHLLKDKINELIDKVNSLEKGSEK